MSLLIWLKPIQFYFKKKQQQQKNRALFSKDNANLIGLILGLEFPVAKQNS